MTTREVIEDFLARKRLAIVGVSRNPKDFSRGLLRELRRRGYEMVPVNPHAAELDGQPCFARVQDIAPPVDGALVMTLPEMTDNVVRDCAVAGITRVWMHRAVGKGAVSQTAVDFCHHNGIRLVSGFCPYMFLPNAEFFHRLHGFFKKLAGKFPS